MENLNLKIVVDKCGVVVTWAAPKSSCSKMTNYFFEVRDDESGKFTPVDQDACGGEGDATACLIPMSVLSQAPYFIDEGANIEMRGKACNHKGCAKNWPPVLNPSGFGQLLSTRSL